MDFWDMILSDLDMKLLIFARILGIFSFNPILSRNNVPVRMKIGATLLLTYVVTLTMDIPQIDTGDTVGQYVFCFLAEIFIGLVIGFVCDLFVYMIYVAGDIMDAQAGLGMAKVFDPSTKLQLSMYGSFTGIMLFLYFFASNAHLTLIRIFLDSYDVIPLGGGGHVNYEFGWMMMKMYAHVLTLMVQLAMPIIAAELIVEFCVGILMKAVSRIQIMAVNIQLKVGLGFIIYFAIVSPIGEFIGEYMEKMIGTCQEVLPVIFE